MLFEVFVFLQITIREKRNDLRENTAIWINKNKSEGTERKMGGGGNTENTPKGRIINYVIQRPENEVGTCKNLIFSIHRIYKWVKFVFSYFLLSLLFFSLYFHFKMFSQKSDLWIIQKVLVSWCGYTKNFLNKQEHISRLPNLLNLRWIRGLLYIYATVNWSDWPRGDYTTLLLLLKSSKGISLQMFSRVIVHRWPSF